MNEVLDVEKPDLVIYTGDLVFGKPASEALSKALEPVVSRRLPFAVTWGNHDDEMCIRDSLITLVMSLCHLGDETSSLK